MAAGRAGWTRRELRVAGREVEFVSEINCRTHFGGTFSISRSLGAFADLVFPPGASTASTTAELLGFRLTGCVQSASWCVRGLVAVFSQEPEEAKFEERAWLAQFQGQQRLSRRLAPPAPVLNHAVAAFVGLGPPR